MITATEETKKQLKKIRGVAGPVQDIARYAIINGCLNQGAHIQFGRDLSTYNLWEALLYVDGYEQNGFYKKGTAQTALDSVLKFMADGDED